ncbi:MAG: MBL fold metallo-hydrolase [Chloroflexota bacterium]|nr:MBL fold metallo-hydrolase [Dehalococcoidia bacterium]MDW8254251.1 MBL fold metallo-hydrolase [Chloroflexota bacterium]
MQRATVEDLGRGVHLFRWPIGFYASLFLVTSEGVVAVDPINPTAAQAFRAAIRSVTTAPIIAVIYSHDHRDHIGGASALAPGAAIIAHPNAAKRIASRGDRDIVAPTRLVQDEEELRFGTHRIGVRYFGPNHSASNIGLILETDGGRLLLFSDLVEPGLAPYRNLPDTDFAGLLHTLDCCIALNADLVLGGHAGPDRAEWIGWNRSFYADLLAATARLYAAVDGQTPLPGEDGVAMTERIWRSVCMGAADALRPKYGRWRGFDAWAPHTADRVLSYLITGN